MDINNILSCVDHTLLTQTATYEEIKEILDDAVKYNVASACIPPYYVNYAKKHVGDKLKICTVVGFPNGYQPLEIKVFEAKTYIENGADEIDMVINVAMLKNLEYNNICEEIKMVKKACGEKILKVIIETCLLTEEEKIKMCEIVTTAGADYIKTSTGFSAAGATFDDIALFKKHVGENVKIKAAGGISGIEDAEKFITIGATRLGTSRIIKIINNENAFGY